jgi:transglutaminase-like putative cysteine protease
VLRYKLAYYDSAAQEKEVDAKVREVIRDLELDDRSDYEKLVAIHDWLCENVEYDSDDGSDIRRTAYDAIVNGKAVCQGYSNALYRLLLEAGVDNRIIFGEGVENNGVTMAHTWNIVDLYGKYYCVDATWDDTTGSLDYFLQPEGEFADSHIPGDEYGTDFFTEQYPVSDQEFTFDVGKPNAAVISCARKMAAALS